MSGQAFRAALDAYVAAAPDEDAGLLNDLLAVAAEHVSQVREASRGHVPPAVADFHAQIRDDQSVHPGIIRAADEAIVTARLAAEYERLRDDPAASRQDVHAAAEALATARQAHRAAAGVPIASGAG